MGSLSTPERTTPLMAAVKVKESQPILRNLTNETLPAASLIDEQPEIDWFKRRYLINFLVEAHAAFDLLPETLFLTVNLIDRYCTKRIVMAKGRIPQIHQLEDICCGLYDAGLFTQMEWHVLETLDWVIGHPTVDFFSQLIVLEEGDDQVVTHMAAYLCEIALYHRDFVSTRPTVMARSSLDLARVILGRAEVKNEEDWDRMENATWIALLRHCQSPSPTLVRKYSTSGYSGVSQRLARFTAEQNAIAHRATGPATPRAKTINRYMGNIYSTSQKGHNVLHVHDYPTPRLHRTVIAGWEARARLGCPDFHPMTLYAIDTMALGPLRSLI
ncbi:G1/S-specific cyclin CCN1 [Fusarium oxysporum f. sp. raphani]|uniref:G1/S-specific cyclin CCN1 n=1 Tax=Fusarium oxysporum f. sp. raphani TaxID=96318 RepID=A0A8J5PSW9_FUSOX|nr:G1/S-specific cyclin CCN1 [Fusarium oxysporum f. sp. raphani]